MEKEKLLNKAKAVRETMDANAATAAMVEAAGGIKTTITQSDKLGYDWENFYVNEVLVRQVYIEQENPVGTEDNPIPWAADVLLFPNFYYTHEGVRKVWTGKSGVTASWEDGNFAEF